MSFVRGEFVQYCLLLSHLLQVKSRVVRNLLAVSVFVPDDEIGEAAVFVFRIFLRPLVLHVVLALEKSSRLLIRYVFHVPGDVDPPEYVRT